MNGRLGQPTIAEIRKQDLGNNSSLTMTKSVVGAILAVASRLAAASYMTALPPGAMHIDPLLYNVVGANYTWRNSSAVGFNPTNTTPPFIQVFDPSFLDVTGPSATIRKIASNPGFAFAHEAPIYVPDLNLVFFASNGGGTLGYSGWYNNSVVGMINMTEVDMALASTTGNVNIQVQTLNLSDNVQMVNGGTGPYKGDLLFVTSGRALLPPSIVRVNPSPPYNATVILDNFLGRQFNSLNDIKILPGTDIMFFTDPAYGWLNGFRPEPMLPSQVYRFDPSTGQVRVVADQFVHPNGIAFVPNGKTAFITDTGIFGGFLGTNQTLPATIYQFDVDPTTQSFTNRRVFAYIDSGAPDGIQLDTKGNVYSGCGDGINVWNGKGTLIGKFYINSTTAQLIFTKSGLVILEETAMYVTNIQAHGMTLAT
ncbi:calcium-dependent phosphotriesterase [Suillus weaverae]|nr:calcium-dependent phosphotriesterase [Suillus weaverae]